LERFFFTNQQDGLNYVCSGSIGGPNYVITAGHCVFGAQYHINFAFGPNWCDPTRKTLYSAAELKTNNNYISTGLPTYDYGIALFEGSPFDSFNHLKIAVVDPYETAYRSEGYPHASPFDGRYDNTCTSQVFNILGIRGCCKDNYLAPNVQPYPVGIQCDSTGGCSGGPWIVRGDDDVDRIAGVNSYGYTTLPGYLFSPQFDEATVQFCRDVTGQNDC
jgi:hypothetical protein